MSASCSQNRNVPSPTLLRTFVFQIFVKGCSNFHQHFIPAGVVLTQNLHRLSTVGRSSLVRYQRSLSHLSLSLFDGVWPAAVRHSTQNVSLLKIDSTTFFLVLPILVLVLVLELVVVLSSSFSFSFFFHTLARSPLHLGHHIHLATSNKKHCMLPTSRMKRRVNEQM